MEYNSFEAAREFKESNGQKPDVNVEALREDLNEPFDNPELIKALAELTIQLRDRLSLYDTILSDDASGRLVPLVLREVIDKKREEENKKHVSTFFLATGRHRELGGDSAIGNFLDEKKETFGKTLVVTEYIETGHSTEAIIHLLENKNIDFDIATVSIEKNPDEYNPALSKRLYYGEVGRSGKLLHGKYRHTGVIRGPETSTFPRRYTRPGSYGHNEAQETINQTRKDINTLSNRLFGIIS